MGGNGFSTIIFLALSVFARGNVRMPAMFGDNMVLQAGPRTPIYGKALPRESVRITCGKQTALALADAKGNWHVEMKLAKSSTPVELKVETDGETIILQNVLLGEVWVCGGQSNMEWSLHDARAAKMAPKNLPDFNRSDIRLFTVRHAVANDPLSDVKGEWVVCNEKTVSDFSLLGLYFGLNLANRLKLPVGLVDTSWGGTPAESWTSRRALQLSPVTAPLINSMAPSPLGAGKESGRLKVERKASVLYNGMVAPVLSYGFKGVIWYQGESNVGRAEQYKTLFPALIQDWRKESGRQFPFLFVQLANYANHNPQATDYADLRAAQQYALAAVPKTGMASAVDLGKSDDIHSPQRDELAKRLTWTALNKAYGIAKAPALGPVYKSHAVEGDQVRIEFDNKLNGLIMRSFNGLSGFEIAGEDRKFVKATARIQNNSIVISSPFVKSPKAVRYAWHNCAEPSFYNTAGLPACPFRTDDWEIEPTQKP